MIDEGFNIFFIYFWLRSVFTVLGLSSTRGEQEPLSRGVQASQCSGFSCCGTWAQELQLLSSRAQIQ